jgi:hypothetical protein
MIVLPYGCYYSQFGIRQGSLCEDMVGIKIGAPLYQMFCLTLKGEEVWGMEVEWD